METRGPECPLFEEVMGGHGRHAPARRLLYQQVSL